MGLHRLIEDFSERSQRCASASELLALIIEAVREIGFSKTALVHNLWFRCPDRKLIKMDNFGSWGDLFIEREYH